MRVLFFGTSSFALPTLQALHDATPRHTILAVVTQPDRPSGRGMKMHYSPVKELAVALGYPVLQPERVRRKSFLAEATELRPDALVVISFGQIISQAVLDLGRYGGINVHASILPRWRGAAPIHHAIIAGDSKTGVATMQMEASLDTGPVYLVSEISIEPDETVGELEPRLAALGGPLLVRTLDALEAGEIVSTPQSVDGMTYASPVLREDGLLDPATQTAIEMERRARGTSPRPGAFLSIGGRVIKIIEAAVASEWPEPGLSVAPGSLIASKLGILVASADRTPLLIRRLQPENKGAMSAAEWARGARLPDDAAASRPAA